MSAKSVRIVDHKWWCAGNHTNVAEYRGDICYGWHDLNQPLEAIMSEPIAMVPTASNEDLDAAAMLLGYHPTHRLGFGSMFCDACATNVTGAHGMEWCPKALPPAGTVIPGHIVRSGGPRHWIVDGTEGRKWDVEERFAKADGKRYLYCPCPSWKFHGQVCKHTQRVESNIEWEKNQ